MSKTSADDWQILFKDWQEQQLGSAQQMFTAFEQWQKSVMPNRDTDNTKASVDTAELYASMQALSDSNKTLFDAIAKEYEKNITDNTQQFLFKSLYDMTQPQNWLDLSGKLFNTDAKLSEKPFISGISDFEERLAYVNDSWQKLLKENQLYHGVVMQSWVKAFEEFVDTVKKQQSYDDEKLFSPRELIDLWTNIANKELMDLHRSESFLAAQKEMLKAGMEYRLHEKNIAEVLCESMHIPTRIEVDELHQSVTQLKRELRKARQELKQLKTASNKAEPKLKPKPKATPKKPSPKAQ